MTTFSNDLIREVRSKIQEEWVFPADDIPEEFFQYGFTGEFKSEFLPGYTLKASYYGDEQRYSLVSLAGHYRECSRCDVYNGKASFETLWSNWMPAPWRSTRIPIRDIPLNGLFKRDGKVWRVIKITGEQWIKASLYPSSYPTEEFWTEILVQPMKTTANGLETVTKLQYRPALPF